MHLSEFEKAVIKHVLKCSGPALHAARSALRHLERAWALCDDYPEFAVFCGITAEEESATAIFHSLKRRRYSGAEGLRPRDHVDKAALHPFLLAIGRAMNEPLNQYSPKLEFNSELSPDRAERLRIRLSIPWPDGSEKWAYPFPPLHFGVSVNGIPQDFSQELHQIASEKNVRSVWEYVQRLLPVNAAFKVGDEVAIQKAWIDAYGQMTLCELIERTPETAFRNVLEISPIHEMLNEGKFHNLDPAASFKSLVRDEIIGAVDASWNAFSDVLTMIYEKRTGTPASSAVSDEHRNVLRSLVVSAYENGKLGSSLATIQIVAEIYAAIRRDSQRKFKPGDWHDILHVAAALPYFSLLLTDGPACHLIRTPPVSLLKRFDAFVESELPAILRYMEKFDN